MRKLNLNQLRLIKHWLNEADVEFKKILPNYDAKISDLSKRLSKLKEKFLKDDLLAVIEAKKLAMDSDMIFAENLRFPIVSIMYSYRDMPEIPLKDKLKRIYRGYIHDLYESKSRKNSEEKFTKLWVRVDALMMRSPTSISSSFDGSLIKHFLEHE